MFIILSLEGLLTYGCIYQKTGKDRRFNLFVMIDYNLSKFSSYPEILQQKKLFLEQHRLALIISDFQEKLAQQNAQSYPSVVIIPGDIMEIIKESKPLVFFGLCRIDLFSPDEAKDNIYLLAKTNHYKLLHVMGTDQAIGVLSYLHDNLN